MPDDDEILEAYERELGAEPPVRPRSNRGFWLVLGTMVLAGIILVTEILVNKPIKDDIAHAEYSLRTAQAAAVKIGAREGSLAAADAEALATAEPRLRYVGPDDVSTAPDQVSVAAGDAEWGATVQARPGACFYLHLKDDKVFYGVGTGCTGRDALAATDTRW